MPAHKTYTIDQIKRSRALRPGDVVWINGLRGGDVGGYGLWAWTGDGFVCREAVRVRAGTAWGAAHPGVRIYSLRRGGREGALVHV